jgi:hypothetical protein
MKIVGCTGHRLQRLGGYSPKVYQRLLDTADMYFYRCVEEDEQITVVSGMALGWDQAFAEAAITIWPYSNSCCAF